MQKINCGTQVSGYLAKQLMAAFQAEVLDKYGSDCGSKKTLEVVITEKNRKDFLYRYIVSGSKLVRLDPDVIGNYVGKKVKLRSPMYCTGEKICNKCAGDMNYKLNNINIGLGCSKLGTTLQKMGMKKFHVSNMKSIQIDVGDMLL